MQWGSSISRELTLEAALEDCLSSLAEQLDAPTHANLVAVFASPHYNRQSNSLAASMKQRFPTATVVGCSGTGVIGSGQEEENTPALSITAALLPDVEINGFHLSDADLPSPDAPPHAWQELLGISAANNPHFIVLGDPFTIDADSLLAGLDYAFPQSAKIGGLASGGSQLAPHGLFLDDRVYLNGAIGVALSGNIIVDTVVAQGCRPIGEPMRITHAEHNMIMSVDGESTLQKLQELYENLSPHDQNLVRSNLFMGIAMDSLADELAAGDFLIRNVVGVDAQRGAVAVGALVREGQLVQFQVRDPATSEEDLRDSLSAYLTSVGDRHASGALLFSCTGRGQYLYGRPDHDTDLFREVVGSLPLGGFFCNGEIGQVSGTTYLHSYTSSFALFRPRATLI